MVFLRRKAHFNAAHRLHNPDKSDHWNKEVFGKCNNEHGHGHNFKIEVVVAGKPREETGFIINLNVLGEIIEEVVIEKCDHKNLNLDVDFLTGIIPSTENLAKAFYEQLEEPINKQTAGSGFLYAVKLRETEKNAADYCPHTSLNDTV